MDLWTKYFHNMATGKRGIIHKSLHNGPQPTSQVGGSQVKPVISIIDRLKRFKKRVGSVIKKRVQKCIKTKVTTKQKGVKKTRQNEFGVRRR